MPTPTTNPFAVQVFDIMHRPGEMREIEIDAPAVETFGNAVIAVTEGTDVHLDVRLESLHDGILVTADVETVATGECVRCLTDIAVPVRVDIAELFAYSLDEAFDYAVVDDSLDLEPLVRDAVVLSLPFQPVCRPDCPGLDPETGERLEDFPDRKPAEIVDLRWSALAGFTAGGATVEGTETTGGDTADEEKR